MKTLTCIVFVLLCIGTNAQSHYCYSDQVFKRMIDEDPSVLEMRNVTEPLISKQSNELAAQASHSGSRAADEQPMTVIPTVIYIVHNGTPASNISMQQIQSQMDQLNEDFAPHGYQFCYAKKDVTTTLAFPLHQPTDSIGVFRINNPNLSDLDEYAEDMQLKALSTLPYKNYLRIFVVSNITPVGVLGYSTFAGCSNPKDGIVMRADVFGSNNYCQSCTFFPDYNLGAVLTHEVGHYLNLYHTFEGGCTPEPEPGISCQQLGDQVCDTPPTTGDYGCPAQATLSCDNTNPRPIHNYMDYTNDACRNSFSMGQKLRMDFSVNGYRYLLKSSANLIATGVNCVELGNAYAEIYCRNYNGCIGKPMTFESLSTPGFTYKWYFGNGDSATGNTITYSYTAEGQYVLILKAINTSLNVIATSNVTVFITSCQPTLCNARKWNSNYTYLDFSSGTPIAENHAALVPDLPFAMLYNYVYREDGQGNPLFHIYYTGLTHCLADASLSFVDSIRYLHSMQVLPVLSTPGKYCLIGNVARAVSNPNTLMPTDSIIYYFIQAQNGTVGVLPDKKEINVPLPSGANYIDGRFTITSIPSCDGQNFWTIVNLANGGYSILKVSADTVTVHQNYYIPNGTNRVLLRASPDGRKIYGGLTTTNGLLGFYILDFDKGLGHITGYREFTVSDDLHDWAQEPCFSPNSRFLYIEDQCCPETQHGNIGHIYQMDLYDPEPWLNKKSIYEFPRNGNENHTPAQLAFNAPDDKIYVSHVFQFNNVPESYRLGVINYPDRLSMGNNEVGYNDNGPHVIPPNCPYPGINLTGVGYVTDQNNAYGCTWRPNAPPTYNYYPTSCTSYKFYTDDCYTHTWNFGDPASGANNTSSLSEPVHNFSAPGSYKITLVANGQTFTDTIHVTAPNADVSIFAATDCAAPQSYYSVTQVQPGVKYIWKLMNGNPNYAEDVSAITVQWNSGITSTQLTLVAIDTVNGCSDSSTTNLSFSANGQIAEPQISVANNVLSTGTYATYQWLLNGAIIPNANQQQYTATTNGVYTVIVTNIGGCADTSKGRQFTITGIEEPSNIALALYPNPATHEVTIVSNFETGNISVYNTQGKQVYSYSLNGTSQTLDIADWAGGVYYIEVNSKGKTARKKFVKL